MKVLGSDPDGAPVPDGSDSGQRVPVLCLLSASEPGEIEDLLCNLGVFTPLRLKIRKLN